MDRNLPRFEVIESDDKSEDRTTSSEEVESEEAPPVDEAMPTMLRQPIAANSPMVPTVCTISANDEFFKKLSENILLGVNAAFENLNSTSFIYYWDCLNDKPKGMRSTNKCSFEN